MDECGDVFAVPDILCNSGGGVVSYFEWAQGPQYVYWGRGELLSKLRTLLERSYDLMVDRAGDTAFPIERR